MPLINSPRPDALPLDSLPATAAQLDRIRSYGRDYYSPINYEQGDAGRLVVLLERLTTCTETGRCWAGRIRPTIAPDGKVISSQVYAAEVVRLAAADEPPKRSRRQAKPKPEQAQTEPPAPEPELPSLPTYKPGQHIRFIGGEHDELTGTCGVIEQVGGARLLVRSDEAGLVTIGPDAVELVEDAPASKRSRKPRKAS